MTFVTPNVTLKPDSFSRKRLYRLKWATIIAIVGIPAIAQIAGATMMFSESMPVLVSPLVLLIFGGVSILVIAAGLYALTTRIFVRFAGAHHGLNEWEAKVRSDAQAFSYRVIARGALFAFLCVSALGAAQLLAAANWIEFGLPNGLGLNMPGIAVLTIVLTYIVILLPTLFIAWTANPLSETD